jgi:hypothetical protein
MFSCRTDRAAETVETLVRVRRREPPLAYFPSDAYRFGVEVEAFDLPEDRTELDIVSTVLGDFGVKPPVVEVEYGLLHGAE